MRQILAALLFALLIAPFTALQARAADQTAIFAGGCFWCVEYNFDHIKGVKETISGYAGGKGDLSKVNYSNYDGFQESVKVTWDDSVVSYDDLVRTFLRSTDVLDGGGQFCDRGDHYLSAIFVMNDEQKKIAEADVAEAEKALGKKIVTPVRPYTTFVPAEDYHQNYWQGQNRVLTRFGWIKQADAYEQYRLGCGRDARVKELWGAAAYTTGKAATQ